MIVDLSRKREKIRKIGHFVRSELVNVPKNSMTDHYFSIQTIHTNIYFKVFFVHLLGLVIRKVSGMCGL